MTTRAELLTLKAHGLQHVALLAEGAELCQLGQQRVLALKASRDALRVQASKQEETSHNMSLKRATFASGRTPVDASDVGDVATYGGLGRRSFDVGERTEKVRQ